MDPPAKRFYDFGHFRIDEVERVLLHAGEPLPLTAKVFDILLLLVENRGHVVEKERLMKEIWPDAFVEEGNLTQNISVLRKVLSAGEGSPQYIQTIPRRGYRFVGSVRELGYEQGDLIIEEHSRSHVVITDQQETKQSGALDETGITKATDGHVELRANALAGNTSRSRLFSVKSLMAVAILVMLVVATVVSVRLLRGRAETTQPQIGSLAVLPLENLSGDPAQDYFADGMTDELIAALAKNRGLRVVSRTSVMRYKGARNKSLPEIARELNVDAIVEGSVLRSGDRVRITAQLIQAASDRHLWGESYERDLRDIIGLQREVAAALTEQIKINLTPQEQERLANTHAANPEAHEAYLKGRYFWNKRTEPGLKKGVEYFEQAINLDHDYALAYSGLADCYISLYDYQIVPPEDSVPQAKAAAARALKIDNDLAEAHASLAYCSYLFDRNWVSAEKEFLLAIELNPNYASARQWHGRYLADLGRFDEALAEMKRAQELDPLSLIIGSNLGVILYYSRQYDQAIHQLQRTLEMEPDFELAHWLLGNTYERKQMYQEAILEYQKALGPRDGELAAAIGERYKGTGYLASMHSLVDTWKQRVKQDWGLTFTIARYSATLGEKEQAFWWLEKAFRDHHPWLAQLKVDPQFDSLHGDPRFADLLRREGLADSELAMR